MSTTLPQRWRPGKRIALGIAPHALRRLRACHPAEDFGGLGLLDLDCMVALHTFVSQGLRSWSSVRTLLAKQVQPLRTATIKSPFVSSFLFLVESENRPAEIHDFWQTG